jgi:hypothetical protein
MDRPFPYAWYPGVGNYKLAAPSLASNRITLMAAWLFGAFYDHSENITVVNHYK